MLSHTLPSFSANSLGHTSCIATSILQFPQFHNVGISCLFRNSSEHFTNNVSCMHAYIEKLHTYIQRIQRKAVREMEPKKRNKDAINAHSEPLLFTSSQQLYKFLFQNSILNKDAIQPTCIQLKAQAAYKRKENSTKKHGLEFVQIFVQPEGFARRRKKDSFISQDANAISFCCCKARIVFESRAIQSGGGSGKLLLKELQCFRNVT